MTERRELSAAETLRRFVVPRSLFSSVVALLLAFDESDNADRERQS